MMSESAPAAVKYLVLFLACELVAAALVVFYIINPCSWPLSLRKACFTQNNASICPKPPCLKKCCPTGEELVKQLNKTPVCNATLTKNSSLWEKSFTNYSIISNGSCPGNMSGLDNFIEEDRHAIQADGSLLMIHDQIIVPMNEFCVDAYQDRGVIDVFLCLQPDNSLDSLPTMSKLEQALYPSALGLDLPFLVATAAVYLLLPELRNLPGLCLLCHVFSLIVGTSTLALVQINIYHLNTDHPKLCECSAFLIQFSILATFFWLNVMCFDLWSFDLLRNLSGFNCPPGLEKERAHKKFILYSLYAWGGPLLIFAISLFMDTASFVPNSIIKPGFGVSSCWFRNWDAVVLYFYLPIGVLILQNIVMFTMTAFRLRVHYTREGQALTNSESRRIGDIERKRFKLYLKLFLVMGINWVMELVSFVVGGPSYIWFLSNIVNTFQGLYIFLIFVWKPRILRMLNQKLCPQWQLVGTAASSARSNVTRTTSLPLSTTHSSNPERVVLKPLP